MGLTLALIVAAQASAAVAPSPPVEKPKLICRESEHETGSHIRVGRRCKTEAEWQRDNQAKANKPASARLTEGQGDAMSGSSGPH